MPQPSSNPQKLFRNLAIAAFIGGIIFASPLGVIIYVASMISVIGIPIAYIVGVIPNISLVIVASYLLWRFIPPLSRQSPFASVVAATSLLLIIPAIHNVQIVYHVTTLTKSNTEFSPLPDNIQINRQQTVALISSEGRPSQCDQTCLHLLLSGQAARVVMAPLKDGQFAPDADMQGYGYALEQKHDCPKRATRGGGARTHAKNFKLKIAGTVSGDYARKLEQGYCLTTSTTTLDEADIAFMVIRQSDDLKPTVLSPIPADLRASKAVIYRVEKGQEIVAIWQQVVVSYSILKPVLWLWPDIKIGLSGTSTEWWQQKVKATQPHFDNMNTLLRNAGVDTPQILN